MCELAVLSSGWQFPSDSVQYDRHLRIQIFEWNLARHDLVHSVNRERKTGKNELDLADVLPRLSTP